MVPDRFVTSTWRTHNRVLYIRASAEWRGQNYDMEIQVRSGQDPLAACEALANTLWTAIAATEELATWAPTGVTLQ